MDQIHKYISEKIQQRRNQDNYRSLKLVTGKIDFTSNDYLGIASDEAFHSLLQNEINHHQKLTGSTGSRLLSGNSEYAETLEKQIAAFHDAPSALIFNSGFDANYGLLSSLPYRGDTIVYDELVHASIHDGIYASRADNLSFKHNDTYDLEQKLQHARGLKYVVTESLFSMDGDLSPLTEITAICKKYEAGLIVDEAHATGVTGKRGQGMICHLGLEKDCLARIHTFGKAIGAHGAAILCSCDLRDFLINYCRPFIFSTALPFHSLAAIKCSYDYFPVLDERRSRLKKLVSLFRNNIKYSDSFFLLPGESPIQSVIIKGNGEVKRVATLLQHEGFDVRPILFPTVAHGTERIRICLHSFNTESEVTNLTTALNNII